MRVNKPIDEILEHILDSQSSWSPYHEADEQVPSNAPGPLVAFSQEEWDSLIESELGEYVPAKETEPVVD